MSQAAQKSPKVSLTPAMRVMLSQIAGGADPNFMAQLARIIGKREENQCARTIRLPHAERDAAAARLGIPLWWGTNV